MAITIERNQKIQSHGLHTHTHTHTHTHIYIYDYTIEKYKKKMCYHQKNNSNVKTFERPKNIKES